MAKTFEDLGIPFPSFKGHVAEAREYIGVGKCSLCGTPGSHAFHLAVGGDIILPCSHCGRLNPLDASERDETGCWSCGTIVPFPAFPDDRPIVACYGCLRGGRAAFLRQTRLGPIRWENLEAELTPADPERNDFRFRTEDDPWRQAGIEPASLYELIRTPAYTVPRSERWPFCCRHSMTSLGNWDRDQFDAMSPDGDGEAYFYEIAEGAQPHHWQAGDDVPIFVFRCEACGRHAADWDDT